MIYYLFRLRRPSGWAKAHSHNRLCTSQEVGLLWLTQHLWAKLCRRSLKLLLSGLTSQQREQFHNSTRDIPSLPALGLLICSSSHTSLPGLYIQAKISTVPNLQLHLMPAFASTCCSSVFCSRPLPNCAEPLKSLLPQLTYTLKHLYSEKQKDVVVFFHLFVVLYVSWKALNAIFHTQNPSLCLVYTFV